MKRKISVLIISEEYPPYVKGGLGIHYKELVNELKKFCDISIIAAKDSKNIIEENNDSRVKIYRISVPTKVPLNHIVFNIKAAILSLKIKHDIVHACSPFGLFNFLMDKKPKVVKIHSVYKSQKDKSFYGKIFFSIGSTIDKLLIKNSDAVITTSEFMKKEINENTNTNKKKINVIYNGINKSFFTHINGKEYLKKELKISYKKTILYVGRLVPRKGALNLIKAAPEVIKKHPKTGFILIGQGFEEGKEYEKRIKKEIKELNLKKHVKLIGWVPHKKVNEYYHASDIFVHPAEYEPFGNIILEAMAAGLPVVASRSGGPEEIIKNNGIVLNNNDPLLISKSILELLNKDKEMKRLSIKSVSNAKRFSWYNNAKQTYKIYMDILKSHENK